MSMISEQVKELREVATEYDLDDKVEISDLFNQAADTIESLSEKLQAANMERTKKYYNGEKSEYDIERILNCLDEIWTFGEEPTDDEREAARDAIDIIQNMERSAEDSKTERLTERTNDGILVKEDYGEGVLKTLYQCYGAEPMPHYANCDEGYCTMEKLVRYEDLEEQREMKGGWIPCSERLPEEKINPITKDFCEYQVTFKSEDVTDIRHYKFGRGHWWNGSGIMDEYVIACRKNLEPYHEP